MSEVWKTASCTWSVQWWSRLLFRRRSVKSRGAGFLSPDFLPSFLQASWLGACQLCGYLCLCASFWDCDSHTLLWFGHVGKKYIFLWEWCRHTYVVWNEIFLATHAFNLCVLPRCFLFYFILKCSGNPQSTYRGPPWVSFHHSRHCSPNTVFALHFGFIKMLQSNFSPGETSSPTLGWILGVTVF